MSRACRCIALVTVLAGAAGCAGNSAIDPETEAYDGMKAYNMGDIPGAFRLLKHAADAGNSQAQVNLGYLYARGQGVSQDQSEALRLYHLSANQGDGEGMNALGYKYLFASGVKKDLPMAIHWFCVAIAKGNPRAMNNFAGMLEDGAGVMKDEVEARNLWEQSANLGDANAMANLGRAYVIGPMPDRQKGFQWLMRAADAGVGNAQKALRALGYTLPLPPPANTEEIMIPSPRNASGHSAGCTAMDSQRG